MKDLEAVAIGSGMKLTCSRDELSQKLAVVARAVSSRTTVLVLGGILLRAENGELQLAATDMELSLRTSLEAQVDGDGAVVVPGKMLVDLIRLLPDEDVQIEHRAEEGVVRDRLAGRTAPGCTRTTSKTSRGSRTSSRSGRSASTAKRCSTRSVVSRAPRRVTSRARC